MLRGRGRPDFGKKHLQAQKLAPQLRFLKVECLSAMLFPAFFFFEQTKIFTCFQMS